MNFLKLPVVIPIAGAIGVDQVDQITTGNDTTAGLVIKLLILIGSIFISNRKEKKQKELEDKLFQAQLELQQKQNEISNLKR